MKSRRKRKESIGDQPFYTCMAIIPDSVRKKNQSPCSCNVAGESLLA